MKTLSCDRCETTFDAETFEEWFDKMLIHYMADHTDIVEAGKDKTKEDGDKWMAESRARFDAA